MKTRDTNHQAGFEEYPTDEGGETKFRQSPQDKIMTFSTIIIITKTDIQSAHSRNHRQGLQYRKNIYQGIC